MSEYLLRLLALTAFAFLSPLCTACPLSGSWDSGFVPSQNSGSFVRVKQTFDCEGHTTMEAYFTRGQVLQAMAEMIVRKGTYTLGSETADGLLPVDITIQSITKTYVDPSSVATMRASSNCVPENLDILVPFDTTNLHCDRAVYPSAGFIENAVVKIEGDKLFWSFFYGPEMIVIHSPNTAAERQLSVDKDLPFARVFP